MQLLVSGSFIQTPIGVTRLKSNIPSDIKSAPVPALFFVQN